MKFAFKSIVVAAAFVAAGAANAATAILDGTTVQMGVTADGVGALTFSENLMAALATGNVTVGTFGGATLDTVTLTSSDPEVGTYDAYVIGADVTSLSYNAATGAVQSVVSVGGATQAMPKNTTIKAGGGNAQVGDLTVNFNADGSASINGSITGTSLAGTAVNFSGLHRGCCRHHRRDHLHDHPWFVPNPAVQPGHHHRRLQRPGYGVRADQGRPGLQRPAVRCIELRHPELDHHRDLRRSGTLDLRPDGHRSGRSGPDGSSPRQVMIPGGA